MPHFADMAACPFVLVLTVNCVPRPRWEGYYFSDVSLIRSEALDSRFAFKQPNALIRTRSYRARFIV